MASISSSTFRSPPDNSSRNFGKRICRSPSLYSSTLYSSLSNHSSLCSMISPSRSNRSDKRTFLCQNRSDSHSSSDGQIPQKWNSLLSDVIKRAAKKWDDYVNSHWNLSSKNHSKVDEIENQDIADWDWDRWKRHFEEVEEQEKIVAVLKSQLGEAVHKEDYVDAAKLKVAIAAAKTNDAVSRAMSRLNSAVKEEKYEDAAFIRDHAGVGLVGWWAGKSQDSTDPFGHIIHISAEHGRYVARSYNSWQLATDSPGAPLFEIFFTVNDKGEYKYQAVYLKRNKDNLGGILSKSPKQKDCSSSSPLNGSSEEKSELSGIDLQEVEDNDERDDDSDVSDGLVGIQNILEGMIPGVKIKVIKVTAPGKVDKDLISKVIEQIVDDDDDDVAEDGDDDENDSGLESLEIDGEVKVDSDIDSVDILDDISGGRNEMTVKVVFGGLVRNLSKDTLTKGLLRVPAAIEKRDHLSFLFSITKDDNQPEVDGNGHDKRDTHLDQRSIDNVVSDLAKSLNSQDTKLPIKVLKDVGVLLNLTFGQAQNKQPLSGSTLFNRIVIPHTSDPLNGLYIGGHGPFTEVIHLKHKFGQWQGGNGSQKSTNLEFYEYVEAYKLTGDPYVPAGEVAFRAKVGKRYQLPHKGIIPEEFGVVARYRGQGRLAEPGFKNPRWVDGELVIFDGRYIEGGPAVGFVYWAPDYHLLVFFKRLRLRD